MLSYPADMAELADAPDLGSGVERRAGSSPVIRIFYKAWEALVDSPLHGDFAKGLRQSLCTPWAECLAQVLSHVIPLEKFYRCIRP